MRGEIPESKLMNEEKIIDSVENRQVVVLGFNTSHQLLLRRSGEFSNLWTLTFSGEVEENENAEAAASRIGGPDLNPVFIGEFFSDTGENVSLFFATLAEGFAEESDNS